jgi:RND superfamily putative drug exporter
VFERIARLTYRHPRLVLAAMTAFVIASLVLGHGVAERLAPAGFTDPAAEGSRASERASDALGYDAEPGIVILARGDVTAPPARAEVQRIARRLERNRDVANVVTPFDHDGGARLLARDRRSAAILVHLRETDEAQLEDVVKRVEPDVRSSTLRLEQGGFAVSFTDVNETVRADLVRAELIAFPVVAILLMIVFRGVVAALLPLLIGGIAVVGTFLALRILSELTDVSIFALNITTALGLGLAVDYGLLLTSRYREELERSGPGWEAHRRTVATAGRAVLFSGLTVSAAIASLLILPQRFLYSMGAGGAVVSLLAAAAALLATPAMFALLGERVNALALRGGGVAREGSGRWYRVAQAVMRHPAPVALAAAAVLIAAALPLAGVTLTQPGAEAVPRGKDSRDVTETLRASYAANLQSPMIVALPGGDRGVADRLQRIDGLRAVTPAQPLPGGGALIQAVPAAPPLSERAQDTLAEVRRAVAPAGGLVGGQTADFADFKSSLADHAPAVIALVAITTTAILFVMTGSLILPLKTLLMNVLSIAATFGLMVLAFQHGLLDWAFGYDGPSALEISLLVVIGATTFGLATDYAVLVLARIKEYRDRGLPDQEAVALGIERTGRVITAAAALLAVVFLAFGTSDVFFMKQVAFGQAVAVIIDASIVRALLVPALMRLLGRWNWWAPAPLRRLLPETAHS